MNTNRAVITALDGDKFDYFEYAEFEVRPEDEKEVYPISYGYPEVNVLRRIIFYFDKMDY